MLGLASMRVGESANDWSLHDCVCCDLLRERDLIASGTGSETTTLILVDASPAMSSRLGTQTRFDLTARALDRLIRSSKSNENIEILTYGYGDKEACQG